MQMLTVYTYEDFYYSDDIVVTLKQDKLAVNLCHLECRRNDYFIFEFSIETSIYNLYGVQAVIEMKLKEYGITSEFQRSVKRFRYLLNPAEPFYTVEFVVEGNKEICLVTYSIGTSNYYKNASFLGDFNNFVHVRNSIDILFQQVYKSRNYAK